MINGEFDDYDTQDQIEEHDLDRDDVFDDDDYEFDDETSPENGSGGYNDYGDADPDYTRYEYRDDPDEDYINDDDFEEGE